MLYLDSVEKNRLLINGPPMYLPRNQYYAKDEIPLHVKKRIQLLVDVFNLSPHLQKLIEERVPKKMMVYYNHQKCNFIYAWKQDKRNSPLLDSMLLQELCIAEWFPRKRPSALSKPGQSRAFRYETWKQTMQWCCEHYHDVYNEDVTKHWMDQCQVAKWAVTNLREDYHVYCLMDMTHQVPLYYLILHLDKITGQLTMKGMWKSLYGTLYHVHNKIDMFKGQGFTFFSCVITHKMTSEFVKQHINVDLRMGLKLMLESHNVKPQFVGTFSKAQGFSVPAVIDGFEMMKVN
jgi:hypothetical protein